MGLGKYKMMWRGKINHDNSMPQFQWVIPVVNTVIVKQYISPIIKNITAVNIMAERPPHTGMKGQPCFALMFACWSGLPKIYSTQRSTLFWIAVERLL